MKKTLISLIVFASGCTPLGQVRQDGDITVSSHRRPSVYADLCEQENMPRYPNRPKLSSRELQDLSIAAMDARIRQHIKAMERHIDTMESIVQKTRRRVEICR